MPNALLIMGFDETVGDKKRWKRTLKLLDNNNKLKKKNMFSETTGFLTIIQTDS